MNGAQRPSLVAGLAAGLLVPLLGTAFASPATPTKLSGIGDSMTQGFAANNWLGDHTTLSWAQGTDPAVDSVYSRYRAMFPGLGEQFVSVSGAEMVGGGDNAAAQAQRICAQATKPNRVVLELGGNDICNRPSSAGDPTAQLYSVTTYVNGLKAALGQLSTCLPAGSLVHVLSMPRVDFLRDAGVAKTSWCKVVWSLASVCPIITGETDATRRLQIGARIDDYNTGLSAAVQDADTASGGKVHFTTDWQGPLATHPNTSVGTYQLGPGDIDTADCFHPYYQTGHHKFACASWESSEFGSGNVPACLK